MAAAKTIVAESEEVDLTMMADNSLARLARSFSAETLPLAAEEKLEGGGTSTMRATVLNMVTIMIGAGVLAYPSLFAVVGVPVGVVLLLGCCCLSIFLCKTLSDAIGLAQDVTKTRVRNLGDLGMICYGERGRGVAKVLTHALFLAKVGCYLVLIGQNIEFVVCPPPYRAWILIFGLVLLPTAFTRDISSLEKFGNIGALASCVYFVTIVGAGVKAHFAAPDRDFEFHKWCSATKLLSTFSIMFFGFCPADVIAIVRSNMRDPKEMGQALVLSHFAVAVVYLFVGIVGYWGFGAEVDGNVTLVMQDEKNGKWVFGYALAVAVVCNLMVTIPLVLFCLFSGIEAGYPVDEPMDKTANTIMRVGAVLLCMLVGLFVPFFLQVLSIMCAGLFIPIAFFLPTVFGYKANADGGRPYDWKHVSVACFVCILGVLLCLAGLSDGFSDLIKEMEEHPETANPIANFWAPGR
eukprot:TRINITY_DN3577_c0_g1_i4.p1 TRINITY_DN3577_c0_g1~~TRINITY_DN3577_c0_g1_i4.p1  ORF type:complete len:464 (+),score=102.52 TRINITY_DN3577_c0_g1_i4:97-1488(+)